MKCEGVWEATRLGYDKSQALLAYLVTEAARGPFGREDLARMFWPQASIELARGNLRRTWHDLQRLLDAQGAARGFFVNGRSHLGFDRGCDYWLDVEAFTRPSISGHTNSDAPADTSGSVERQLALYRGEFLQGLSVPQAPVFEEWLCGWRNAMRSRAQVLLGQLAHAREREGRLPEAIDALEREIALKPCAEGAHRRLIELLARSGRNGDALLRFDRCRALLQQELGLEPSAETLALARAIQRPEPGRSESAAAPAAATARRPVCVLAAELRADPALSAEEGAELAADHHGGWMKIVAAHGGEGFAPHAHRLFAYFGHGQADERAPIRTLEAALSLLHDWKFGTGLQLRLGAHCGWAVIDRRFPGPDATGQLTQRAAGLAAQAGWSQTAVSPALASMVEGFFVFDGPHPPTVLPWLGLVARSAADHRLQAQSHCLSPFVGRSMELRRLRLAWERVRDGKGAALLVRAEAGMGKSRLIHEHLRFVNQAGGTCWVLRCQPQSQSTPYYPFVEFLEVLMQPQAMTAGDADANRARQLERWIDGHGAVLARHRWAFAELLRLPTDDSPLPWSSTERRLRLEEALQALFRALSRTAPTMLVIEDLHWVDASSLAWLSRSVQAMPERMMLLLSSRSRCALPRRVRVIDLEPLPPRWVKQLVRQVWQASGVRAPDAEVLSTIVRRADGVPLYLEEMARAMRLGLQDEIPATIWQLLAMRLESTGEARQLAQQAAVIGRDFDVDLLQALWDGPTERFAEFMAVLIRTGLVRTHDRRAFFGHALLRDTAYESLSPKERKRIHARLVGLYRGRFRHRVAHSPEQLAGHLALAGESVAAAQAWLQTGQRAAERCAYREAIFHFESGIALLDGGPESRALELALQVALGNTRIAVSGYGAQEAKTCFQRSLELSRSLADDSALFPVMWGLWLGGRSCTPEAYPLELTHRLERIARADGTPLQAMQVHYAYGNNLFFLARHAEALDHLQRAVAIGDTLDSRVLIRTLGEDTTISSRSFLAWVHWVQGRPETAASTMRAAVAAARELGHAHTLGFALAFSAILHRFMLDPAAAQVDADELSVLAGRHELVLWKAVADGVLGWAAAARGDPHGLQRTLAAWRAAEAAMSAAEATFAALHAEALYRLGRFEDCAAHAGQAIERAERQHDRHWVAEFWRLRGEALSRLRPGDAQALTCLRRALALATRQGATALAMRAAAALCRQSDRPAARAAPARRLAAMLDACPELARTFVPDEA